MTAQRQQALLTNFWGNLTCAGGLQTSALSSLWLTADHTARIRVSKNGTA